VELLACWKDHFGIHYNIQVWKMIPLCFIDGIRSFVEHFSCQPLFGGWQDPFFFFLISQCIIYIKKKKKAPSASKYTRITQSASSIQRKPKSPKPLSTQKVYKGTQKTTPDTTQNKQKTKTTPNWNSPSALPRRP
jgi:hypothetical protein